MVYAVGRLVIFAPTGSPLTVDERLDGLARLLQGRRRDAASPSPIPRWRRTAAPPKRCCASAGCGTALRPQLVLGDSIAQAAQFATTGNAVGGLIAYSLVLAPGLRRPRHVRA